GDIGRAPGSGDQGLKAGYRTHGRSDPGPRLPAPGHTFAGCSAYFLVITHCCSRPRPPLATWYRTRPAGRNARTTPKMIGIVCIIFCCIGSMPVIGVSFCVDHMIAMLSAGRMKYGSRAV